MCHNIPDNIFRRVWKMLYNENSQGIHCPLAALKISILHNYSHMRTFFIIPTNWSLKCGHFQVKLCDLNFRPLQHLSLQPHCIPLHTQHGQRKKWIFKSRLSALWNVTYLCLDEPLGSLNLGLTESPSVLGTHIRPYCQVGGLLQSLGTYKIRNESIKMPLFHMCSLPTQVCFCS